MDEFVLLAAEGTPDQPLSWLRWNRGLDEAVAEGRIECAGRLGDIRPQIEGCPAYLLLPQERVLAMRVQLPNSSRAARAAIPFQLEEQLSQDPEQLHFAVGATEGDHAYPVLVTSRDLISDWCTALDAAATQVRAIYADAQALLSDAEHRLMLTWADRVLLRTPSRALAVPETELDRWLSLIDDPLPLKAYDGDALSHGQAPRRQPLMVMARHFAPEQAINLLQGAFKRHDPVRTMLRFWRAPLWLAAAVAVVLAVQLVLDHWQLKQQKAALDQAIEATYRQAFPEAKRIVNPKAQMRSALEKLQQQAAGEPLLRALAQALPAFRSHRVELESLRFDRGSGELLLTLRAPSLAPLQGFAVALEQSGLRAKLGQFNQQGGGGRAQVVIEELR